MHLIVQYFVQQASKKIRNNKKCILLTMLKIQEIHLEINLMPHVTTILGDEVGIQHQGVQDKSILQGTMPVIGLMIGKFKRGRFDRPMIITKQNIKSVLGYDPENSDYVAVSDALDAKVPSVNVLRLKSV